MKIVVTGLMAFVGMYVGAQTPAATQTPAPATPPALTAADGIKRFSGIWKLNHDLSRGLPSADGSASGQPSGAPPGGGQGGQGGQGGSGGRGGGGRGGGGRHSDIHLKHDVVLLGRLDNGLGYYRFSYNGSDQAYVGVIAQDVQSVRPEAVLRGPDGYLWVNYDKLGLRFMTLEQWQASGARIPARTN